MEFWRVTSCYFNLFCDQCKDLGHPEFYLEGLWYPIVIAAVSFVVGMVYIKIKIKTLTNKKHSYESDKRLLGLVWIALAVATAYYCIDIFEEN
jgi:tryptophan-rich sensory protein